MSDKLTLEPRSELATATLSFSSGADIPGGDFGDVFRLAYQAERDQYVENHGTVDDAIKVGVAASEAYTRALIAFHAAQPVDPDQGEGA